MSIDVLHLTYFRMCFDILEAYGQLLESSTQEPSTIKFPSTQFEPS